MTLRLCTPVALPALLMGGFLSGCSSTRGTVFVLPAADASDAKESDRPADKPDAYVPGPGCGLERPNVSDLLAVDGLAVDTDGTLYTGTFETPDAWVGRKRPGGAVSEPHWARIPGGLAIWGVAIARSDHLLYVSSTSTIYALDLAGSTQPPSPRVVVTGLTDVNDLVTATDGSLYYSHQGDGNIYRVTSTGVPVRVTNTPVGDKTQGIVPAGLAFGPGGFLFVGIKPQGPIYRLSVRGDAELGRATFGAVSVWGNGLAFDERGRLYISTYSDATTAVTNVLRLDPDGGGTTVVIPSGRFAGLTFGRGALDCRDLYVANPDGPVLRLETDTPGQATP